MSSDLQWLLIRGSNSFIVKKVLEGPIFSREPGNPLNIHSYKYSGLANAKTIDVEESGNSIKITTRKTKASPHSVKRARHTSSIRGNSGPRRALGVAATFAKSGYRPDLRKAVLARVSAIKASQSAPKFASERPKKVRGKKAKTA